MTAAPPIYKYVDELLKNRSRSLTNLVAVTKQRNNNKVANFLNFPANCLMVYFYH